jgi:hypothetical protein
MWHRPKSNSLEDFVPFVLKSALRLGIVVGVWIVALHGHLVPWLW